MPSATGTVVSAPGVSATSSTSPTPSSTSSHHGLSGGAIAGIVIGSVAFVAALGAAFFFYGRSRTYGKIFSASQKGSAPGGSDGSQPGGGVEGWVAGQQAQHEKHQSQSTMPTDGHTSYMSGMHSQPTSPRMQDTESAPTGAQLVGYNRQSGAPEYSYEAPGDEHQVSELQDHKKKPSVPPVQEESTEGRMELPG